MVRGFLRVLLVFINFYLFFYPLPPARGINNINDDSAAAAVREEWGRSGVRIAKKGEKVARPTTPKWCMVAGGGGGAPASTRQFSAASLGPEAH